MRQQEVRTEFIEDIVREKIDGASGKLRREMEEEFQLCLGPGVFIGACGLVDMSSQVFRN